LNDFGAGGADSPPGSARASSLLIIRPGAIGDCLLALPAIHWLMERARAAAAPDGSLHIEVWVPTPVTPLISGASRVRSIASTGLDQLGIADRQAPQSLVETLSSFGRIVSWYGGNRPEFRAAAEAANPNWQFLRALPPPETTPHAADYFASQIGAPLGCAPSLAVQRPSVRHDLVAIQPFSGSKQKNWPLENYRALVRSLPSEVASRVAWIAGPEEQLEDAVRFDDLGVLAEWLAGARLYIGNDSGISHLAAAVTSSVVLFGPTDPAVWAPRGRDVRWVRHQPIAELPVETVREQVSRALACDFLLDCRGSISDNQN
jgi:heptosyltransferase III